MAVHVPATAAAAETEFSRKDEDMNDDFHETEFVSRGCCSFFRLPCFKTEKWERISASEREQEVSSSRSLWGKGIQAVKKVREWSELVAGPKWKTFIRRFKKTPGRPKPGKFQYDPFSYALNFDEGPGQSGQFEDERIFRDFSSRYAAIPAQNGQLKEVPLFA
ncbi:hypothetical protein Salat_1384400 [Sesamum alatum]|uniref:Uncharacterized protein n=1 Tax=Sesamum alatum TaxID=300844 RepID=A0AAE1Y9F6_9LAMI|nr:hypothetical protein Salat_1384400 [Sesamum alatum]